METKFEIPQPIFDFIEKNINNIGIRRPTNKENAKKDLNNSKAVFY